MTKIPTKWQYIRDYCKNTGLHEAARVADKIDRLLEETYPDQPQTTFLWDSMYEIHDLYCESMDSIILNPEYCIGCKYTDKIERCEACKFSMAGGAVLYRKFRKLYYKER